MIKYKYGFEKLNKKDTWIVESDGEETNNAVDLTQTKQRELNEDELDDESVSAIDSGTREEQYEIIENLIEIDNDVQTFNVPEISQRSLGRSKNNVLFNGKYFTVISRTDKKIEAKCSHCKKVYKGYGTSSSNFINHLKIVSLYYSTTVHIVLLL